MEKKKIMIIKITIINFLVFKRHLSKKEIIQQKEKENIENDLDTEYLDTELIDKDKFIIKNRVITSKNMNNYQHKYIFTSEKYQIKRYSKNVYKFKIKLNDDMSWLAFGICDKKKVEENEFIFIPSKKML